MAQIYKSFVRTPFWSCALLVAAAFFAAPSAAHAKRKVSLFSLHGEAFGAKLLDDPNRKLFGFGAGGALRVEWNITPWIGVQAGGVGMWFSKRDSDSTSNYFGLAVGPRLHWSELLMDTRSDGWLDINFDWGSSGGQRRSGFDVGLGYEFALKSTDWFRIGPFVRYQWGKSANLDNPSILMFGLAATLGYRGDEEKKDEAKQQARPNIADTDGDGILDPDDFCPTVPQGGNPDPQRPGCPLSDRDGDGVLDSVDLCPDVPQGDNPDPQRPGCPLSDRDGDTIADAEDACPDEPGAPSTDPKRNGCPGLVRVTGNRIEISEPVFFATNQDRILEKSYPVLHAVADAIAASPWIKRVRIEGHTDSRGSNNLNLDLSRRRAASVANQLVRLGVAKDRLYWEGFGEERPIESNNTELGRSANRRVEFHIVDSTAPGTTTTTVTTPASPANP